MSGTQKLLARIKALFAPSRPAAPAPEVEEAPIPAAPVVEMTQPAPPEPITSVAESPPATVEEAPAVVAAAPPAMAGAPAATAEAPIAMAEAPVAVAEAPTLLEEVPPVIEEAPTDVQPAAPAAAPGALTLKLENERGPRSMFEVTKSGATIGRGPESTIQLPDLSVSRKHAKITYKQGAYWLSDLGSMGGTWIDGTKLAAPRRVAAGQTIDIGLCRLTVISAGAEEKSPAARGPSHAA